jgi:hypothetical protein
VTQLLVTEYTDGGYKFHTGPYYGFYKLEPCCKQFEDAWNSNIIGFGEKHDGFDTLAFETGFNIFQVDVGWECDVERTSWPIKFCPFCGTPLTWRVARRGPNKQGAKMEILEE